MISTYHKDYVCEKSRSVIYKLTNRGILAGHSAVLPSPLSRVIRFVVDSSPLTISDDGVSLQRTRKSKSVGGVKGKAAKKTQAKKTTKAVRV